MLGMRLRSWKHEEAIGMSLYLAWGSVYHVELLIMTLVINFFQLEIWDFVGGFGV